MSTFFSYLGVWWVGTANSRPMCASGEGNLFFVAIIRDKRLLLSMDHPVRTRINLFVVLGLSLAYMSCTTIDAFTSLGDGFHHVADDTQLFIVTTDLLDNQMSRDMEYAFIEALADYGMIGLSWIDMFPPVKDYNAKDYRLGITEKGVDIIVNIELQDSSMETGVIYSDGYPIPYADAFVMFEFSFEHIDIVDPILVTQIKVEGGSSEWEPVNAAASKRAVEEYCTAAGIEPLPPPPEDE